MPPEIWLGPNRRILWLAAFPEFVAMFVGVALTVFSDGIVARAVGIATIAISAITLTLIVLAMRQPRIGYADHELLVNLRLLGTIRVPVDCVECFFLGQGPSMLTQPNPKVTPHEAETANVVVRLAEAAERWQRLDVLPILGHWCDGYVTLRGAWCEPINGELVKQMNHKLVEAHRALRRAKSAEPHQAERT